MTRKKNSILLTTSALLIVMPTLSMADNNGTTDVYSEVSTQPMDFIARAEAFKLLDVVDRQGNEIGNISDFIIDFGGSELLYTLLAIEQGENGAFAESDAESDADDESDDSEDDSGENEGGQSAAFYPLPLDALRLVALEDLTAATSDDDDEEADGQSESSAEEDDDQTSDEDIDEALANMTVNDVVGTPVVTEDDETISDISDVVVLSQEPHFVMGVGGFLGIGETNVAIRARQFSLDAENERFVLPLTADQLRDMPDAEYTEEARLPQDMLLGEAFETAAEMPADSGDEAPVEEETANDDEASADDEMEATEGGEELPGDHPLDGMVLMLSISRDDLANAPSFSEGEFPNVEDDSWHETIVGFYDEILSETADTSSQESVEVNGDSDDEEAEAASDTESEDDSGDESEDDTESNGQN